MTKTMNPLTLPTLSEFKEFLSYDPDAGLFTWIKKRANNVRTGQIAGGKTYKGYISISFRKDLKTCSKRSFMAHRLAWFFIYNKWPTKQIDHINGVRDDNRIKNLREVTNRENQQNNWRHREGKFVGVNFRRDKNKWRAYVNINKKQKFLGYYLTEIEAHIARKNFLLQNPQS